MSIFREAFENLFTLPKRKGALNIFQGKTEFRAQVLTHPVPYAGPAKATDDPETLKKLEGIPSKFLFMCRILDDQMAHNKFLTDPCLQSTTVYVEDTALLTSLHTRATLSTADTDKPISPGDHIYVTADPGDNNMPYDLQNVVFSRVDLLFKGQSPKLTEACQSLADLFGEGMGPHLIDKLVAAAEKVSNKEYVEGEALTKLTSVVGNELNFWVNKVETDASVYDKLKAYWNNVGYNEQTTGKTPMWVQAPPGSDASTHWSAAFISYVMTAVDSGFPKSAAHAYYAAGAAEGKGGWTLWSLNSGKFKAQVGDILIKKRPGSRGDETHGDVVYQIESEHALLAGGNVSHTAKVAFKAKIDKHGYYDTKFIGDYTVILKKKGKIAGAATTS